MKKNSKKAIQSVLSFVLAMTMLLALAGCGGNNDVDNGGNNSTHQDSGSDSSQSSGPVKDSLVYGVGAEPASLDPSQLANLLGYNIADQIFDPLLIIDPDGDIIPGVAETWEYNDDKTEITFHLREGVTFHNGEVLTADDVVFTYELTMSTSYGGKVTAMMDHMEKLDDRTCKLVLKFPFAPIEQCIASSNLGIICKSAYDADPEGFGHAPVGCGAYKMVAWNSGESIVLEKFTDYWRGEAAIKDLTFRIITDSNTSVMALQSGELDFLTSPARTQRQTLLDDPDISYYETENSAVNFIALNNESGPFANKLVRQALSHAVDVEDIILGILDGNGSTIAAPFPMDCFGYPEGFERNEYDPELARSLLAEAGYPDGIDITIKTTAGERLSVAEILQSQLAESGFNVDIQTMEFSALQQDAIKRQYEAMIFNMVSIYPDADTMYGFYHSSMLTAGTNYQGINSPELDKLLDRGRVSTDDTERKEIYRQVCELFKEECFNVPMYVDMTSFAAHKDLKGVKANSRGLACVWEMSW